MIKLIASDVDGTLVKDSAPEIYPEIFEEIKRIQSKGIKFCIASGRQYYSVARMFEPVADDIIFLVENGAHVRYKDTDMSVIKMKMDEVREIIHDIRSYGGLEMVVSTTDGCLLESKDEAFIDLILNGYHNKARIVEDVLNTDLPIIKVAAYKKTTIRKAGEEFFIPKWSSRVKCCMAGEEWVDFMDASVDKGNALCYLQEHYGITPDETMVFGDNENDMGLLRKATYSYAVENARDEVKACANYTCGGYIDRGVLGILKNI